ncbi:MAG: hypothetical protein GY829_12580, partial [Gammaproteobacteria bacterium]|nr:hypothetical protein [Gammaproteobacteria bacterium]
IAIETSFGYGAGGNNTINNSQVEDHQLRLMELAKSNTESNIEQEEQIESEEESTDC